jgi:hypothetical protein
MKKEMMKAKSNVLERLMCMMEDDSLEKLKKPKEESSGSVTITKMIGSGMKPRTDEADKGSFIPDHLMDDEEDGEGEQPYDDKSSKSVLDSLRDEEPESTDEEEDEEDDDPEYSDFKEMRKKYRGK